MLHVQTTVQYVIVQLIVRLAMQILTMRMVYAFNALEQLILTQRIMYVIHVQITVSHAIVQLLVRLVY